MLYRVLLQRSYLKQLWNITTGTAYFGQVKPLEPSQDDWQMYMECLDQFFTANDNPDGSKKKAVLLAGIGAKAYSQLRNLLPQLNQQRRAMKCWLKL